MEAIVKKVMADVFVCEVGDINQFTTRDDLENWDSLQHLIFISKLEKELRISFSPDEINSMFSFISVVAAVKGKM